MIKNFRIFDTKYIIESTNKLRVNINNIITNIIFNK